LFSRRSDLLNERLPIFQPTDSVTDFPVVPAPSMRRRGSGDIDGVSMEELIRRALEEPDEDGLQSGTVERIAERVAIGRKVTGKPMPLKRFETA
jgi:serine/threonine-protein phosphatase 2B catalytic subunit